jgi:AcrR family transcriptional regulator
VYEKPEAISAELRDRVFDAVRAELLDLGIDRFGIDGVARRAGVEPSVIREHWHDRRVLLMAVMLHPAVAAEWSPDTGSLYTDLDAVTALAVTDSQTATGRALFRRVLPGSGDVDLAEISSDLWKARFDSGARILRRAADRGQLRDGVDPDEAIRMFAAAFYYDVIFADSPVRPEYADQVVDIFLHGVLGAAGRDRPWFGIESLLQQSGDRERSSPADHAVEAARRAVALMRAGADALIDPVVLYEAVRDEQGRIVDFACRELNRAACEESGLPRTELLGQRLLETLPGFASSGLLAHYANCLDRGEPLVLNDFAYQHFDQPRRLDIRAARAGADLITVTWRDAGPPPQP